MRFGRTNMAPPLMVIAVAAVATVLLGGPQGSVPAALTRQRFTEMDSTREQGQRATDVLKVLAVSTGDWVADVGAGNGYYSWRLSEAVGSTGKVYAEDISDYMLNLLYQRVNLFDLKNVEVVNGEVDNPNLPPSSLSAVLIIDAYHHFLQPQPMTEQILRSLKPGGRLVIGDYSLPEHGRLARADQLKMHEIDPALVRAELERVGFEVLKCEDPFVKRIPGIKNSSTSKADLWLMLAVRPR